MEFLVRVVDKGVAMDCSMRGDVIVAKPDGWTWSPEELTNDFWRIVRVPVLQSTVDALLSSQKRAPGDNTKHRRREYMIDFSLLPNPSLFTGVRTQGIISLTQAQVVAAAKKKP